MSESNTGCRIVLVAAAALSRVVSAQVAHDLWSGSGVTASSITFAASVPAHCFDDVGAGPTEAGNTVFRDGHPVGAVHWLEWQTPAPTTVREVWVFAAGDEPNFPAQRTFSRVRITAKSAGSPICDLVICDQLMDVPYPEIGCRNFLVSVRQVSSPSASSNYRAEFIQTVPGVGPRIVGLDAFGVDAPPLCRADFNCVAGVTVQDIYDFLGAWNAGCP